MTIQNCAVRRAAEHENVNLTRRGQKLVVAFDARILGIDKGARARVAEHKCSSSGLARAVEHVFARQRELHPEKHPAVTLRQSVELAEAGRCQALRRTRGRRVT